MRSVSKVRSCCYEQHTAQRLRQQAVLDTVCWASVLQGMQAILSK